MSDSRRQGEVLRYRARTRLIHALLATSFLVLLSTGLVLMWGPLSGLAAGGNSRWIHRIAAVGFMAVPLLYLALDPAGAKELLADSFRYDRDDLAWLRHMWGYVMGRCRGMPPQGRLNAGQKLHHAAVVLASVGVVGSGLALWSWKGLLGPTGTAWAAIVHDLSMLALTLLLVGHLYFTFVYGALSGMTNGYVPVAKARLEHSKWVGAVEGDRVMGAGAATSGQTQGAEAPVPIERND